MPLLLLLLYLLLDYMSRTPLTRGIAEWHMSLVKHPASWSSTTPTLATEPRHLFLAATARAIRGPC